MKLISGGQSGVDRAALDVAIERDMPYGGWCPQGGWAEDFRRPPGLLTAYPALKETPLADPAQRTEWNVLAAHACLILVDSHGLPVSKGTVRARELIARHNRPYMVVDVSQPAGVAQAAAWLRDQRARFGPVLVLAVGGPRESEAPGIYESARECLRRMLGP
jgi:hypothetical protein